MDAAEDGRSVIDLAHGESDVVLAIHAVHEAVDLKVAVLGREFGGGDAFDEDLMLFPVFDELLNVCLLYTSPSPRDRSVSRMPSSA